MLNFHWCIIAIVIFSAGILLIFTFASVRHMEQVMCCVNKRETFVEICFRRQKSCFEDEICLIYRSVFCADQSMHKPF